MQKIVDEVLEVEKKAKDLIDQARQDGAKIKSDVEQEVAEQIKNAREKVLETVKSSIAAARKTADESYKKAIEEATGENAEFMNRNASKIDDLINKVVDLIITPEFNRD